MKKFSEDELKNIINDYNDGMKPIDLSKKYKRNSSSIINKLKSIGVYVNTNVRFSKDDEEFLREIYPTGNWELIFQRFKNASKYAIHQKASKLGIKAEYYFWKESDLLFLKDHFFNYSLDELYDKFEGRYSKEAIRTKAFRKYGYSTDDDWTSEEDNILINYYSIKNIDEIMDMIPNRTKNAIINHSTKLGLFSKFYIDTYWNDQQTQLLINNWEEMTDIELSKLIGKEENSIKEKRRKLGFYRINKDYSGYNGLKEYLRGHIGAWKTESMKNCNYRCIITGSKKFHIHHIVGFDDIANIVFDKYNIELKDFDEYTIEELNYILEMFNYEHNKYPLGVCLREDIHILFHKIYGKHNNSYKQLLEFIDDYCNGKFLNVS